jgi:predicted ATPase/DNA-binding NarL/FixJ family response regulator
MSRTGSAGSGYLPAEVTSFVGRGRELEDVKQRLSESRLVTLIGIGGTGKTRLAIRVAADLRRTFPDGVWLVDLTQLHTPGVIEEVEVPDVLADLLTSTLRVPARGGVPSLEVLVEHLAERRLLLILDNCEHLLPVSAILADALLRHCSELRILCTSREPLTIAGETLVAVPPLPVPNLDQRPGPADVQRYESVMLFLARAKAALPSFTLTADNRLAVAHLCRELDGLPLAIELAAARIRVLAPQQILDRLTDRFAMLSRGHRDAPDRQQTLRACLDWSFDLCDKSERLLWARLSVFGGGFELDAVQGICAGEDLPGTDLLDLVGGLIDKSILVGDGVPGGDAEVARYRMLETIRDYGREKLCELGDVGVLRRRHSDWYQGLVTGPGVAEARSPDRMARLTRDHSNLRTALEFCLTEPGEAEAGLQLIVSLPRSYWSASGRLGEGRYWLDHALAQATAPTALRLRGLLVNSHLALGQGDNTAGMRLLDDGEELARHLGASRELGHIAYIRGAGALFANDLPVAVETLDRARTTLSGVPDLGSDLYFDVLLALATAAGLAGHQARAGACQQEMQAIVDHGGDDLHRSLALWSAALLAWLREDLPEATARVGEALRLKGSWGADDRYVPALCLELSSWIAADQRRHRRAATLMGAADARWTDIGAAIGSYPHLSGHRDIRARELRNALDDTAFTEAAQRGQVLPYDDALAYALDEPPRLPPAAPQEDPPSPLSRREMEVAKLITRGLSNRQIAATLVISQRTAEGHVQNILTKLGFASRSHVAAWISRRSQPPSTRSP